MITSTASVPAVYPSWDGRPTEADTADGTAFSAWLSQTSSTGSDRFDVARCSRSMLLLSEPLLLPTARNVRELSAELSTELSNFFREKGIESQPPVQLSVNENTGRITVTGDRTDAAHIEEFLNGSSEIRKLAQTINALSSHAYTMPQQIQFQQEYRASSDPLQIVAKYASLFGSQKSHDFSILFNGDAVQVLADGRPWITT